MSSDSFDKLVHKVLHGYDLLDVKPIVDRHVLDLPSPFEWRMNLCASSKVDPSIFFIAVNSQVLVYVLDNTHAQFNTPIKRLWTPTLAQPVANEDSPFVINAIRVQRLIEKEVLVAVSEYGEVCIWRTDALDEAPMVLRNNSRTWGLAIHSDSGLVAVSANNFKVTVFNMVKLTESNPIFGRQHGNHGNVLGDAEKIDLIGHTDNVPCVDFNSTGRFLASCSIDQTCRVWDLKKIEEIAIRKIPGRSRHELSYLHPEATKPWCWSVKFIPVGDVKHAFCQDKGVSLKISKRLKEGRSTHLSSLGLRHSAVPPVFHINMSVLDNEESDEEIAEIPFFPGGLDDRDSLNENTHSGPSDQEVNIDNLVEAFINELGLEQFVDEAELNSGSLSPQTGFGSTSQSESEQRQESETNDSDQGWTSGWDQPVTGVTQIMPWQGNAHTFEEAVSALTGREQSGIPWPDTNDSSLKQDQSSLEIDDQPYMLHDTDTDADTDANTKNKHSAKGIPRVFRSSTVKVVNKEPTKKERREHLMLTTTHDAYLLRLTKPRMTTIRKEPEVVSNADVRSNRFLSAMDRLNMVEWVPDLELFIAASQKGAVALMRILEVELQDGQKTCLFNNEKYLPLSGLQQSPLYGMTVQKADIDQNTKPIYRLYLFYLDGAVLSYHITRHNGTLGVDPILY